MPNSETPDPRNPEPGANHPARPAAGDPLKPGATQRLLVPRADEAPIRVQKVDQPAEAAGQTLKVTYRPAQGPPAWKSPLLLGSLLVLGGAACLALFRARNLPAPPPPQAVGAPRTETIPPAAKATFEQAGAGDVRAMHMLGLMYYNGLNLPRDREKGLYWLRKAAEGGSAGARVELSQIEGGR